MTIEVGDTMPEATLTRMTAEGPAAMTTGELFGGKKVLLFGLPGAFTPTCSAQHLPGYVTNAEAIKAKGVDLIACMAVNDVFVMGAWGKDQNVGADVLLLADGSGAFTAKLGLELDLRERGLGVRSKRFAMVVEDGKVTRLDIEDNPGEMTVSGAEAMLGQL